MLTYIIECSLYLLSPLQLKAECYVVCLSVAKFSQERRTFNSEKSNSFSRKKNLSTKYTVCANVLIIIKDLDNDVAKNKPTYCKLF